MSDDPGERGAQTRSSILAAAIARFGREGFRSTSVADIARDAGVSGSLAYNYFDNKEALFLAALDQDSARLIDRAVGHLLDTPRDPTWTQSVLPALVAGLGEHPLANRVLAGLEPHATSRMVRIPAMADLRDAIAERVTKEQAAGVLRSSIDADLYADGLLSIWTALLMVTVQLGTDGVTELTPGVAAVFDAALA